MGDSCLDGILSVIPATSDLKLPFQPLKILQVLAVLNAAARSRANQRAVPLPLKATLPKTDTLISEMTDEESFRFKLYRALFTSHSFLVVETPK